MQFYLIHVVVWIFLKRVWKIIEIALADYQNEGFDYHVRGFVDILVCFNK